MMASLCQYISIAVEDIIAKKASFSKIFGVNRFLVTGGGRRGNTRVRVG